MRRKSLLAASFVFTTVCCNRDADHDTIHANPPPQPQPTSTDTTAATTTPSTTTTPSPTPVPNDDPDVSIVKTADGKCLRVVNVKCPPGK